MRQKQEALHPYFHSVTAPRKSHLNLETDCRWQPTPCRAQSKTRDDEHNYQADIATSEKSNEPFTPMDGSNSDGISDPGASLLESTPDTDVGHEHLAELQQSYLTSVGSFQVLPKATQDILVTTYIVCINGLLPILHSGNLLRQYSTGRASRFLIQAICLVACKTQQAVPYLRLSETDHFSLLFSLRDRFTWGLMPP